jgi:hypothetical protein
MPYTYEHGAYSYYVNIWSTTYNPTMLLRPTHDKDAGTSSKTRPPRATRGHRLYWSHHQRYLLYTLDRRIATFESLPTELLREILDCLGPIDELTYASRGVQGGTWTIQHCQRTLAAVARTCRRLTPIANDILYCRYEALYQEPAVGYIERFDTDPLVRRRLRHVKIIKLRDIRKYVERYKTSQSRVRESQKTFSQIDPFSSGGWTFELVSKES